MKTHLQLVEGFFVSLECRHGVKGYCINEHLHIEN